MRTIGMCLVVAVGCSAVCLYGADKPRLSDGEIRRALSAAPSRIAAEATVVAMDSAGNMKELRHGTNGWTCLPRDLGTPQQQPLCLDKNGLAWYEAAMAGKAPDPSLVGYSYMLQGGSVWSNLDPAATRLAAGQKDFIHVPPHVMILNARAAETSGFPSGVAEPDPHKPFVMFGGTPFAVLIIPVQ